MSMKAGLGVVVITISLVVVAAGLFRSSATQKSKANAVDSNALRLSNYREWTRVNPQPVMMDRQALAACAAPKPSDSRFSPHLARYISVFVNEQGREAMMTQRNPLFPPGSIIVKEKLPDLISPTPELLTVMVKKEKGYNPESGDWEYLVLDGTATEIKEQGKLTRCNVCHVSYQDSDYVTRTYLPREARLNLK